MKILKEYYKISKIVVSLLLFFTIIHFAKLPFYEHDLLQPFDDSRSFDGAPEYAG
jgi:hypothetical protein